MPFKLFGNFHRILAHENFILAELTKELHPIPFGRILRTFFNNFIRNIANKFCMLCWTQFVARYEVTDIAAFENYICLLNLEINVLSAGIGLQIFYKIVALILVKQVVALAYIFGRYGICYCFAVVCGIEFVRTLPNKAVRKVLYRVNFVEAVA